MVASEERCSQLAALEKRGDQRSKQLGPSSFSDELPLVAPEQTISPSKFPPSLQQPSQPTADGFSESPREGSDWPGLSLVHWDTAFWLANSGLQKCSDKKEKFWWQENEGKEGSRWCEFYKVMSTLRTMLWPSPGHQHFAFIFSRRLLISLYVFILHVV